MRANVDVMRDFLERVRGIEPLSAPWQGAVLPLYDTRVRAKELAYASEPNAYWQAGGRRLFSCNATTAIENDVKE